VATKRSIAGLAIIAAVFMSGCAPDARVACKPDRDPVDAATALQLGKAFALKEPALLERINLSSDEFAVAMRRPGCCRSDKVVWDNGSPPEWWVSILTPDLERPWEIVVHLDLCGGYRSMDWVQLQRLVPSRAEASPKPST
jgi:hypothetical protein